MKKIAAVSDQANALRFIAERTFALLKERRAALIATAVKSQFHIGAIV